MVLFEQVWAHVSEPLTFPDRTLSIALCCVDAVADIFLGRFKCADGPGLQVRMSSRLTGYCTHTHTHIHTNTHTHTHVTLLFLAKIPPPPPQAFSNKSEQWIRDTSKSCEVRVVVGEWRWWGWGGGSQARRSGGTYECKFFCRRSNGKEGSAHCCPARCHDVKRPSFSESWCRCLLNRLFRNPIF